MKPNRSDIIPAAIGFFLTLPLGLVLIQSTRKGDVITIGIAEIYPFLLALVVCPLLVVIAWRYGRLSLLRHPRLIPLIIGPIVGLAAYLAFFLLMTVFVLSPDSIQSAIPKFILAGLMMVRWWWMVGAGLLFGIVLALKSSPDSQN